MKSLPHLTAAHTKAARWLADRGGDGCFDIHGIAFAQGEIAPIMRSTWNALRDVGAVEFYNPAKKGYGRLRLTAMGETLAAKAKGRADD